MLPKNYKTINKKSSNNELREFFNLDIEVLNFNDWHQCRKYFFTINEQKICIIKESTFFGVLLFENTSYGNDLSFHNESGPARIENLQQGISIRYYKHGALHRVGYPAFYIIKNNVIIEESYYINNVANNSIGPARRYRDNVNSIWNNKFVLNNQEISLERFCNRGLNVL